MTAPRTGERGEQSRRDELILTLWLVAVLLAQVVLMSWFFERLYAG
jgi:hypothetical protein